ncbi:DUF4397 domain-containing protein [Bacterioplanoides sp. SCSIO 12839]|uniref:DUF4397 domain-containing protein n=1 Tax=Bacterioplanoides sp. SCSIO 12839 TaxID=2829569 RepID=UPI002105B10C|nr:DUF4397 domain-containing protein [Bacterioplanoides sp. SCSIO 12839]UTW47216.1 DUF4397 domain-containing protein [Bacterioplanoides sp. SCSIO 12839]
MKIQQLAREATRLAMLVPVMSLTLVGCGSDDDDDDPAYVRVLHASPDAPAVDVLVNGSAALTGVSYQQGSGYLRLEEGNNTVALRVSGTETIALEQTLTLSANGYYSVIAQNDVANIEFEVLDDTIRRGNDSNDVTVVHASPDAGSVDVYVTANGADLGDATLPGVPFDANATLPNIADSDYQVRITGAGSSEVVYNSGSLTVNTDVTAVAVNSNKGASPVSLLIWAEAESPVTPVLDNTAEVRIVHAVDSVSVDVFAGGAELLGDFNYLDTTVTQANPSGYVKVAAGALPVAIAPANQGIENALANLSGTLTLERGESYTVIAAGDLAAVADAELITLVDKRENTSTENGDVRLVHASSADAADPVDIFVYAQGSTQPATPTFADVVLGQARPDKTGGYTALPAGTYTVDIAADGTTAAAVPGTNAVPVAAGAINTAIAVGNGSGLSAILLNDKR